MDIKTNKWLGFYEPFFDTSKESQKFVEQLEVLCPDDKPYPAKIVMHLTQRLITLADDILRVI